MAGFGVERQGDFLDVLSGGGEQALGGDGGEAAETGIAMSEELLGVGEGALDHFPAALVEAPAPVGQAMGVGPFPAVLPALSR